MYDFGMPRSVLLRHDLPDGTWHYDWLIEREDRLGGATDPTLMTFRVMVRPDEAGGGFDAEHRPDHRRVYLEYEGSVGGGRGNVTRVAEWKCDVLHVTPREVHVRLEGPSGAVMLRGVMTEREGVWRFEAGG